MNAAHRYIGQLDSLRAFAVLAVIFSHTIDETYAIGAFLFFEFGAYGVYLFFVLSAYLITSQLLETQRLREARGTGAGEPLRTFYAKRALRLFPAYFLALIGGAIVNLPGIRAEWPWHSAQLSAVLFALDREAENTSTAGHFWSLSVEWLFYLVWPFIVFFLPRRWLPWVIGAMFCLSFYTWLPDPSLPEVLYRTNVLQSLDSLAMGAMLAYGLHQGWRLTWLKYAALPACLAFVACLSPFFFGDVDLGDLLEPFAHEAMNLAFCAFVYMATQGVTGPMGAILNAAPLQYLGKISYGVYVYHGFILEFYWRYAERFGLPALGYGFALTLGLTVASIVVAAASWRWLEAPINSFRHRLGAAGGVASAGGPEQDAATPPPSARTS